MLERLRADDIPVEDKSFTSFDLCDLEKDKPDNLGNTVREILWRQTNYAIYRSDKGVYVHFSDSKEEEKDQRKRFTEICPELCELRYLTAQMKGSNWRPSFFGSRKHTLYDNNMAQALMLMMGRATKTRQRTLRIRRLQWQFDESRPTTRFVTSGHVCFGQAL
jgi:hypothetical protein